MRIGGRVAERKQHLQNKKRRGRHDERRAALESQRQQLKTQIEAVKRKILERSSEWPTYEEAPHLHDELDRLITAYVKIQKELLD